MRVLDREQTYDPDIHEGHRCGDSLQLVRFMLQALLDSVQAMAPQVAHQVTPQVARLIKVLTQEMGRVELQSVLGLSDRKSFFERYLRPALELGLVEMTRPGQPNSRMQKYRLTEKGKKGWSETL